MAPEIPLDGQRPAEYVFDQLVREAMPSARAPNTEQRARPRGVASPGLRTWGAPISHAAPRRVKA